MSESETISAGVGAKPPTCDEEDVGTAAAMTPAPLPEGGIIGISEQLGHTVVFHKL